MDFIKFLIEFFKIKVSNFKALIFTENYIYAYFFYIDYRGPSSYNIWKVCGGSNQGLTLILKTSNGLYLNCIS